MFLFQRPNYCARDLILYETILGCTVPSRKLEMIWQDLPDSNSGIFDGLNLPKR